MQQQQQQINLGGRQLAIASGGANDIDMTVFDVVDLEDSPLLVTIAGREYRCLFRDGELVGGDGGACLSAHSPFCTGPSSPMMRGAISPVWLCEHLVC